MIHGLVELIQQLVGITMNKLRLEIETGYIFINDSVSCYVAFYRDDDQYIVSEIYGHLTIEQLGLAIERLKQMEEELNVRN